MATRKSRVLVVAHAMAPWQLELWRMAASSVDIHIVTAGNVPNVEGFPITLGDLGFGHTHTLGVRGLLSRGHTWWWYDGLSRLIADVEPDLLHLSTEPWGFLAHQGLRTRVPVIIHGAENVWRQGNPAEVSLRLMISRRALRKTAGFVSWNSAGITLAGSHGLPPHIPRLVCPFVLSPPGPYVAQRERIWHRAACKTLTIGYAGRLLEAKGLGWLIDALAMAQQQGVALRLEVAGSGPFRDSLVRRAARANVDMTMLGALPTQELPTIMGSWDVAVVPSLSQPTWMEQFGRSAVEAMMCGLPTIVSDSGALPEVAGPAGIVVAEGDVEALARAVAGLADTEVRRLAGKLAAAHVDVTYGAEVLSAKIVDFWSEVLAAHTKQGFAPRDAA